MRAHREWHIEERFGRVYVVNQFGGFEGWHDTLEAAFAAGKAYVTEFGDTFAGVEMQDAPTVRVEIRTMNKGRANEFERAFTYCPNGHECVSAAVETRTGKLILAGDLADESCGYGGCQYGSRGATLAGLPVTVDA